jgi:hypothetical protein
LLPPSTASLDWQFHFASFGPADFQEFNSNQEFGQGLSAGVRIGKSSATTPSENLCLFLSFTVDRRTQFAKYQCRTDYQQLSQINTNEPDECGGCGPSAPETVTSTHNYSGPIGRSESRILSPLSDGIRPFESFHQYYQMFIAKNRR